MSGRLTVLGRPHGSCIDVHVRIYFDSRDLQPCHLQQETSGRSYMREFQNQYGEDKASRHQPMTPLPMPLTTPPETIIYFVMEG